MINITKILYVNAQIISTTDDIDISIRIIKETYPEIVPDSFHFKSVSLDDVKNKFLNLNPKKSSTSGTILVKILDKTIDVHSQNLKNAINHALQTNCFPDKLKQWKVIPVFCYYKPQPSFTKTNSLWFFKKYFEFII